MIAVNATVDIVCACPIIFDEDESRIFITYFTNCIIAFFIITDMNFNFLYDKQKTLSKLKTFEKSPTVKRICLISPSPTKRTSIKSNDQSILISDLSHQSDITNDNVSYPLFI